MEISPTPHQIQASLSGLSLPPVGLTDRSLLTQVAEAVGRYSELPLVAEALFRLFTDLSPRLTFHTPQHTLDVLHDVLLLGIKAGLAPKELELLAIAAAYHDLGYLDQDFQNEPIGAAHAREAMQRAGYGAEAIHEVELMILSTQLHPSPAGNYLMQSPRSALAKYLCDADLATLGKRNFFKRSLDFYQELSGVRVTNPMELRNESGRASLAATIKIMHFHTYHTPEATELYGSQKAQNLRELQHFFIALLGTNAERIGKTWNALQFITDAKDTND